MGSHIWIKEEGDIGPEIQTTQKILILERIWSITIMTTKTIFYEKLGNMKVVGNFIKFPESTRTQEFEFV
jgi:hypothetical protein